MKKPATIAKCYLPNPALRNRIAAGAGILVLLVCTVFGVIIAAKQRTAKPTPAAESTEEDVSKPPASTSLPIDSKSSVKNPPVLPKQAKPLRVEHLAVLPREFEILPVPLTELVEPAFTPRTRNHAVHQLPDVVSPSVLHGMVQLEGVPFHTDYRAACEEAERLNHHVFVVEYVGFLHEGEFSSKAANKLLKTALRHEPILDYLTGGKKKIGFSRVLRKANNPLANTNHVVVYLCQPNGTVLHALVDPTDEELHHELRWLEREHHAARQPHKVREVAYLDQIKAAHGRASRSDQDGSGKFNRRLHDLLTKTPRIDELNEWIWKLLLK